MSPSLAVMMTVLLACGVAACKDEKTVMPTTTVVADAPRDKEQARAALMALPELKAWSAQIEKASNGTAHPALMEDDPGLKTVNGQQYWELTFAEDGAQTVQRRETFLVPARGNDILVRDFEKDATLSLAQWRAARLVAR
ncbi:MAG: hypothetical protein M3Y65_12395 [Pseudomonadota bacterium]|nr:hypothetical protein [Pseudomonadota bacterium]